MEDEPATFFLLGGGITALGLLNSRSKKETR